MLKQQAGIMTNGEDDGKKLSVRDDRYVFWPFFHFTGKQNSYGTMNTRGIRFFVCFFYQSSLYDKF